MFTKEDDEEKTHCRVQFHEKVLNSASFHRRRVREKKNLLEGPFNSFAKDVDKGNSFNLIHRFAPFKRYRALFALIVLGINLGDTSRYLGFECLQLR